MGRNFMSDHGEDIGGPDGPAILIYSPHAGTAIALDDLKRLLAAAGIAIGEAIPVQDLFERQLQGSAWAQAGFRAVIAAGGDGTIGTVATHLQGSGLPIDSQNSPAQQQELERITPFTTAEINCQARLYTLVGE